MHAGALAAAQQLLAELEAQGTLATLLSPAQRTSAGGAAAIGAASMAAPKPASMTSSIGSKVAPSPDSAEVPASCVAADATAAAATAAAAAASGKCGNTSRSGAVAAEGGKQSDECAGWQLVLTGHGQGAGVAVVLGCRLLRQYPGRFLPLPSSLLLHCSCLAHSTAKQGCVAVYAACRQRDRLPAFSCCMNCTPTSRHFFALPACLHLSGCCAGLGLSDCGTLPLNSECNLKPKKTFVHLTKAALRSSCLPLLPACRAQGVGLQPFRRLGGACPLSGTGPLHSGNHAWQGRSAPRFARYGGDTC